MFVMVVLGWCGTTSACAENTRIVTVVFFAGGNYLRVRGDSGVALSRVTPTLELPPRARRIRDGVTVLNSLTGTTSACAENTAGMCRWISSGWNYLRVRGEYPSFISIAPQR